MIRLFASNNKTDLFAWAEQLSEMEYRQFVPWHIQQRSVRRVDLMLEYWKNLTHTNPDPNWTPEEELQVSIQGDIGEHGWCLFTGQELPPMEGAPGRWDTACRHQVRCATKRGYRLLVQKWNHSDDIYIHTVWEQPWLYIYGYAWGWEVQQDKYFDRSLPRPAYLLPNEELHPIARLVN